MVYETKVKLTFITDCLGSSSNDPDIHRRYIASKAPDAKSLEEEVAAIGVDGVEELQKTVFPKTDDGTPFFWDYQIKGFFKDACSALQRCKGNDVAKESLKIKSFKKIIDGNVFISTRKIKVVMPEGGTIGERSRSLRASTAQGERIALASSETIPSGSTLEFTIQNLNKDIENAIIEWLDYGKFKGLGQWRNAGWGRFTYEILDT